MLNSFAVNCDDFCTNTFNIWLMPKSSSSNWSVPRLLFVDSKFATRTGSGDQLSPGLDFQRAVDSKFTGPKLRGYTMFGGNVCGLSQVPSKDDRQTQGNAAHDLGQLTSGTDRQSCKRSFKSDLKVICKGFSQNWWKVDSSWLLQYKCVLSLIHIWRCRRRG